MIEQQKIQINHQIRALIEEMHLQDAGSFTVRASRRIADSIAQSQNVRRAVLSALEQDESGFRGLNNNDLPRFTALLVERLETALPPGKSVRDAIMDFKAYAQRTLVHGFNKKNRTEEYCRSNLQTYLEQMGRTTREVISGGGSIDVMTTTGEPIEAKLWNGPAYLEAGIDELREYMRTEATREGYYVVFDTIEDNPDLPEVSEIPVAEGRIIQIAVRMAPRAPSKRRARRIRRATGAGS